MKHYARILLATLAVASVVAMAASTATASNSIEVRGGAERGIGASGSLTFNGTELGANRNIIANVTLRGTLSTRIPKIERTLFGRVTGVAIEGARAGEGIPGFTLVIPLVEENTQAPVTREGRVLIYNVERAEARLWKFVYVSFLGRLPEISGILFYIEGTQFNIESGIGTGAYNGRAFGLIEIAAKRITGARPILERTILPRTRNIFYPANGTFASGTRFAITPALTIELL
jgi:hypothetical protein